jgi:SAM-dependent methyltransferase
MQSQFTNLAPLYDSLMAEIPYERWVDYVFELAGRQHHVVHRVLDVGCGTGNAAFLLAKQGCEVVGFDASRDMIEVARRKAAARSNPRFFVSKMEDLCPPQSGSSSTGDGDASARHSSIITQHSSSGFDTAISLFDTVNYVTDPSALQRAFSGIYQALEPGGLFMFDMNTPYALEMEMFTQNNLKSRGEPKYSWVSRYNPLDRLTTVDMTFYVKRGNTRETVTETHHQRAYTLAEIAAMLKSAGFSVCETLDAFTFRRPVASTDRAYFVARREVL